MMAVMIFMPTMRRFSRCCRFYCRNRFNRQVGGDARTAIGNENQRYRFARFNRRCNAQQHHMIAARLEDELAFGRNRD